MRNSLKKTLFVSFVLCLSVVCGFWCGAAWERNRDIPFNQVFWQAGSINQTIGGDVDPIRHRMVEDLQKRYLHTGSLKRRQVIALLGEPSESMRNTGDNEISYWLNERYSWGVDPVSTEYLVITFDSDEYVSKVSHKIYRRWLKKLIGKFGALKEGA